MLLREVQELLDGTGDPAFAVGSDGDVVGINQPARALFGTAAAHAVGRPCWELVRGTDSSGFTCSSTCTILRAMAEQRTVANFDLHAQVGSGRRWCNVTTLGVALNGAGARGGIHILQDVDLRKRLELALHDFVGGNLAMTPTQAASMVSVKRTSARAAQLSPRELEVLRLLAGGGTTASIARRLRLSRATVNNHVQHCLDKLGVSSRLEAIRRAEAAGLLVGGPSGG